MVALLRVGLGFRANLQLPVHHDPLGGQFEVLIVREAQLAVDRRTVQFRRSDIENNIHVLGPIVTTSSLAGTFLSGQVDASDHRFSWPGCRLLLSLKGGVSAED